MGGAIMGVVMVWGVVGGAWQSQTNLGRGLLRGSVLLWVGLVVGGAMRVGVAKVGGTPRGGTKRVVGGAL